MGLLNQALPAIFSFGDKMKRRVRGLLDDPIGAVQQAVDQNLPTEYELANQVEKYQGRPFNQAAIDSGQNKLQEFAMNNGLSAMTAWHGSPHKFTKFSLDKIGTGEGAQAYGHGLYLAESPEVARSYQMSTSRPEFLVNGEKWVTDQGGVVRSPSGKTTATLPLDQHNAIFGLSGSKSNKPLETLAEEAESFLQTRHGMKPSDIAAAKQAILDGKIKLNAETGALYKTDIPDEAVSRFLDWDKPLSQQAPEVRKALGFSNRTADEIHAEAEKLLSDGNARAGRAGGWMDFPEIKAKYDALNNELDNLPPDITGADFYRGTTPDNYLHSMLSNGNSSPASSSDLLGKGIPGIRYLDGGSRSAGSGSSNFVVFDPEMIRILERNGEATGMQPWQPGEWGGLLK